MLPQLYFEDVKEGMEIPCLEVGPITTEHLVRWACAAGDYNPIHYDQEFARSQGLPTVIVHGPFKLSLLARMLLAWGGPNSFLRRISCRYTAIDVPGNTLFCRGRVKARRVLGQEKLVDCEIWMENQKGEVTVKGEATIILPSREER
ncbi:MAG: hypothetical protein PWP65_79 [Clostridia bacterium]|nr:hypothetical protein [Clostridia bacterium]